MPGSVQRAQGQECRLFSPDTIIEYATRPSIFGYKEASYPHIRLAVLRVLAIYLSYEKREDVHSSIVRSSGMSCIIDIAMAYSYVTMEQSRCHHRAAFPTYDVLHSHDNDTSVCRCDSRHTDARPVYCQSVLDMAVTALVSLSASPSLHCCRLSAGDRVSEGMSAIPDLVLARLETNGE